MGSVNGSLGVCHKHWECPRHKHLKMSARWDRAVRRKTSSGGCGPGEAFCATQSNQTICTSQAVAGRAGRVESSARVLCTARRGLLRIDPLAQHLAGHRYTTSRQELLEILRQGRYEGEPLARSWMGDRQGKRVQCLTPEPGCHAIRAAPIKAVAKTGVAD